jgi:hypothetical protein
MKPGSLTWQIRSKRNLLVRVWLMFKRRLGTVIWLPAMVALLVVLSAGCKQSSDSSGTGSAADPSTGTGAVGFSFQPASAYAYPGQTVHFTLVDGIPPYRIGYVNSTDIGSYDDPNQIQGSLDSNKGEGAYLVGPNGDCIDKLAAEDGSGRRCFLTVYVLSTGGSGTDPSGGGTDPSGGGSDPSGGGSDPSGGGGGGSICPFKP